MAVKRFLFLVLRIKDIYLKKYSTLPNVAFSRQAEGGSTSLKRCGQYSDIENHLSLSKYGNKAHYKTT